MIDSHCHLEVKDYNKDLDAVIERCKKAGIKALISSCANPKDFEKSISIAEQFKGFVFIVAGIHPEYIKEVSSEEIKNLMGKIKNNEDKIYGIGETGIDRFWVKEPDLQEKQKELFARFIELAKSLDKPVVVHTREASDDVIEMLKQYSVKKAHLHLWGSHKHVKEIIDNGWHISVGPIITRSKVHKKIVRDMPLDRVMLETDSPWFGGKTPEGKPLRGEPTNIKIPAEKIAEIKKISFDEVWKACGENAARFYGIKVNTQ